MEPSEITMTAASNHYTDVMGSINSFYLDKTFCDASIVCSDGVTARCHKLVLAATSDMLARAMMGEEEEVVVLMPDLDSGALIQGLDALYGGCPNSSRGGNLKIVCEALSSGLCQSWLSLKDEDGDVDEHCHTKIEEEEEVSNPVPNKRGRKPYRKRKSLYGSNHERLKAKVKRENDHRSADHILDHVSHLDKSVEERLGTWIVRVNCDDSESVVIPRISTVNARYMALVGVKRSEKDFDAVPLAWSHPELLSDSAIVKQLKLYGKTVKNVFGLSDLEIFGQLKVRHLMAIPKTAVKRTEVTCTSSDKLKSDLEEEQIKTASKKGVLKGNLGVFFNEADEVALNLVSEIAPDKLDGIMLIIFDSDEQATAHILNPCVSADSTRDERDEAGRELFRLFFKAFLLRTKATCYEGCLQLMEMYNHYAWLKRRHDRAVDILSGAKLQVTQAEKVCEECGKSFSIKDKSSKSYYDRHMKEHYFEKYQCDCQVTWTNIKEKRNHVMLVHMQGYIKCDHCDHVTVESAMAGHVTNVHCKMTCEYCGTLLTSKYGLKEHIRRLHPEKVPKQTLKKQLQGVTGMCSQCGIYFKDLKKHTFLQHQGGNKLMPCDICGKNIKKSAMKGHVLHMHTPESELPHPCSHCPRKFSTNHFLKRHIQAIHEKLLLFACQFEGCNAAYSHDATLSKHQRMQHKITYNEAVRKGLAPPKSKEQALLEHQQSQKL